MSKIAILLALLLCEVLSIKQGNNKKKIKFLLNIFTASFMVPMADGVELFTLVYYQETGAVSTIMMRTPYGIPEIPPSS